MEKVTRVDEFTAKGRTSHCYRIMYRAMDRTLTNGEVDALQGKVREESQAQLGVTLR